MRKRSGRVLITQLSGHHWWYDSRIGQQVDVGVLVGSLDDVQSKFFLLHTDWNDAVFGSHHNYDTEWWVESTHCVLVNNLDNEALVSSLRKLDDI